MLPMAIPSATLPAWVPTDPDYAARVHASFRRQGAMRLLGARLTELRPGYCRIELPYRDDLTQQHGYIHAGVVAAIVDSAGGYAAYTLFPVDASVLTVEYKLNLMAPGKGEAYIAQGRVMKAGRTLCVTQAEVFAVNGGKRSLFALMQQTLIVLAGRSDHPKEQR
jgi:uncharacterized protein (TIGR00369 family)